jgi:hypothetical protein
MFAKSLNTSVNSAVNLPKQHAGFNPVELLAENEFTRVMLVFGVSQTLDQIDDAVGPFSQ